MTRFRPLVLAAVLLVLIGGASAQGKPLEDLMMDFAITPLEAQPAPALTVTTVDGDSLTLADLKGQAVLVYFMATW